MNLLKILPAALLLSVSLSAFAQDDDDLLGDGAEEQETAEVAVPTEPTEAKFFHRVQIGFVGTSAKYTNNSETRQARVPASEKYFLKGLSLGWMGDLHIAKDMPLYLELGGSLAWETGSTDGEPEVNRGHLGDGFVTNSHYKVNAVSFTIPISASYQFRNIAGVDGLTLAPVAGLYARFNLLAKRKQTKTETEYGQSVDGRDVITGTTVTVENKSLMEYVVDGGWMEGRSHTGKLVQVGAQLGVNAFYKHYSFGFAYMCDLTPFARHSSPLGLSSKDNGFGGQIISSGTGCDMKISTRHNFALTVGYVF